MLEILDRRRLIVVELDPGDGLRLDVKPAKRGGRDRRDLLDGRAGAVAGDAEIGIGLRCFVEVGDRLLGLPELVQLGAEAQ